MSMRNPLPLVGIPAGYALDEWRAGHRVAASYVDAVFDVSGCMAVLVPACGEKHDFATLIDRLDGLFVTGGAPNVEPERYGGKPSRPGTLHDPNRDATVLPLIRQAVEAGLPLFAVCLGIQELNVAMGGSLHQLVHEVPGKNEHRMDRTLPPGERGHPRHPLFPTPGGLLSELLDGAGEVMVNSLHAQAIDRLADPLSVEGVSDDGVIEAVGMPGAKGFVLGVQWHPESRGALESPLSQAMFGAFGDACRARRDARNASPDTTPHTTGREKSVADRDLEYQLGATAH